MTYVDPAWFRREYLAWHRSLDDIADQVGCRVQALSQFARDHGIPVRVRGSSIYMPAASAPGIHPRDLPEPLRSALIGPRARGRLDRLLFIAGHPSITAAAQALGLWHSALHHQVVLLERACGGQLVNRAPRPAGTAILTPLGKQLCQQARGYLGHQPATDSNSLPANVKIPHPPQRDLPEPLRIARRRAGWVPRGRLQWHR